ncbi:MAG: tRNA pseudouridine(54/55) synthase Pus10, partial [Candidatus Bathyarchaeia archaeon]
MAVQEKALMMLEKHSLCDFCLGRQFAFIARNVENNEKGKAIKSVLFLEAQALAKSNSAEGKRILKILAFQGFFKPAYEALERMEGNVEKEKNAQKCFLCGNCFEKIDHLAQKAVEKLKDYEFNSFLVGIELPHEVEEREDEFRARFKVEYGENMKVELGRLLSRKIALQTGKPLEYAKPDVVLLINPIEEEVRLQINPLYIAGRYKKLVRGIPQSKWLCSKCNGKGCEKCNWTGKMYSESVEEIISKPFLEASLGVKTAF